MCLFRLSELYCVSTKMRRRSELRQLLMGMSMRLYFPAMGTAGFDSFSVRVYSCVPRPPPRITARHSFMTRVLESVRARRRATPGDPAPARQPRPEPRHSYSVGIAPLVALRGPTVRAATAALVLNL